MKHCHLVVRVAAVAVPMALALGSTGAAFAAKPPRTPAPNVTSTPAKASNSTSATFVWTAVASTTYTCSLDGSAYSTCASPKAYSGLANRLHTFALRAKLNNGKPSTYSYQWTVDTVAPVAPVVSPIAGPTSNTSASVAFSDSDTSVTGFTCALDAGTPVACTSPHAYSGLLDGVHTVVVTARDAAGNAATGSASWTVDHTAPNIPVVTGPSSPTNNPDATVTFSGEAGATFSCSLDGGTAAACSSPWTTTGLADGSHTLAVTAVDAASNTSTGSATWVVDRVAPAVPVLVSSPASPTNDPTFTVRFADTDLSTASYRCTFQGATSTCASPFTPAVTPTNGSYSVEVRAVDLAGNVSGPLTASWTFDNNAPSPVEFVSGPQTPTNVTNPTFDFIDTDTTTVGYTCQLDAGATVGCQPGVSVATLAPGVTLADGAHTLSVVAYDGTTPTPNTSAAVVWHWILDTTGPVSQPHVPSGTSLDSGPVTSTPTFVFTNSDPAVAGFVCKLDGATTWTPCASGYSPSVADGSHTLQVATVDQAGNVGTPIVYSWTLDRVGPLGVLTFPRTLTGAATIAFPEQVQGVTTSTVRLRLAGTATVLSTRQVCLAAAGTVVSCSGAGVRTVRLTPTARLLPGQKFVFGVSSAVHDAAGNPARAATTVFRAQRLLQERELAVGEAWAARPATAAYGGRYLVAHYLGAQVSSVFRGTTVTWYTATGPAMGTAKVYCGATLKATVNNYAARGAWHVARTVRCSSTSALNTLRIVATGLKGSTHGKGTNVVVDAIKVGTLLTSNPALTQRWARGASSLASGGGFALADQSGEAFALTFRGTSITWRTLLGKSMGMAKVYVDGAYKGTVDQFAATSKAYSRIWKLTDKVHTLRVVATGTRRAGATGSRVVLDALTVG